MSTQKSRALTNTKAKNKTKKSLTLIGASPFEFKSMRALLKSDDNFVFSSSASVA